MKEEKQEEKMKEIKQKRYKNENEYNDISIKENIKEKKIIKKVKISIP